MSTGKAGSSRKSPRNHDPNDMGWKKRKLIVELPASSSLNSTSRRRKQPVRLPESDSEDEQSSSSDSDSDDASSAAAESDSGDETSDTSLDEASSSSDEEEDEAVRTPTKRKRPPMRTPTKKGKAPVTPTKRKTPSPRTQSWRSKRVAANPQDCQSSVIPPAFKKSPEFRKMTALQKAKAVLHVSATPDFLPRREREREQILQLIGSSIMEGGGTCVYIHGVPGTGKTATVHSVVRELQKDSDMDDFHFIEINGMKISEPASAFSSLWNAISGNKASPRQALANLEQYFNTRDAKRKTIVLLVDELDQMITKKQDVVYNFFNWPHLPNARLTVVAIANTMDLPERELSGKIRSRLGSSRVAFGSYKEVDLKAVLQSRLEGIDVFEPVALDSIARRVANVTGDARRALDIARRAVETRERAVASGEMDAQTNEIKKIGMAEVSDAYKAMMAFTSSPFIRHASLHEQIFLLALSQCVRRYGVSDIPLEEIVVWHLDFIRQTACVDRAPSHKDMFEIAANLAAQRLVVAEGARSDHFQRIRPAVDPVELFNVLSQVDELKRHVPKLAAL